MTTAELVVRSQQALGMSQRELAEHLGSSQRTGSRWVAHQSRPSESQFERLAREVYPRDPDLARLLARAAGTNIEALIPRPVVVSPPPKPPPTVFDADAIVCAAADAMNVAPSLVRPAVNAAIARAKAMGIALEDVASFLG
jgi:transcriptional regulator with XRE-family HTH domain